MTQNTEQKNYDPDAYMAREHIVQVVVSTEQNVRTREEQAETLAFEIALWGKSNLHERSVVAAKNLREAEARGAAEQRRKDAEGSDEALDEVMAERDNAEEFIRKFAERVLGHSVEWSSSYGFGSAFIDVADRVAALEAEIESLRMTQAHSDGVRNEKQKRITALEARVKELEAALSHLLETEEVTDPSKPRVLDIAYTAFMSGFCGKNPDDGGKCDWFTDTRPKIMRHIENARAALTREGGV